MNPANKFLRALAVLICLGVVCRGAGAQTAYTFNTFTVPNSTETAPLAINDAGEVTGFYGIPPSGGQVGFLRLASGEITTLLFPGASGSVANGVSRSGVIAGTYWGENESALADFFYRKARTRTPSSTATRRQCQTSTTRATTSANTGHRRTQRGSSRRLPARLLFCNTRADTERGRCGPTTAARYSAIMRTNRGASTASYTVGVRL